MVLPFVFLAENKDTFTFDFDLKKRQNTEGPPKKSINANGEFI
jgi:hypothetical protein